MNLKFKEEQLDLNRFSRLGSLYILALCAVATIIIVGQVLIQVHLRDQIADSRVVNVAGRQRMLSQQITKNALFLAADQPVERRGEIREKLKDALQRWKISQEGLLMGSDSLSLPGKNSEEIRIMFNRITPHFDQIYAGGTAIVSNLEKDPLIAYDSLKPFIVTILSNESTFLAGMDGIVFQYDDEARAKVATLSRLEYVLIFISLFVIFLEILFVFRPTTLQVNKTVNHLVRSEQNAKQLSKEIGALYGSLEKSYEQLSQVNQPAENPKLYAKTGRYR